MRHVILEGLDFTGKTTVGHWVTSALRLRTMVCHVSETAPHGIRLPLRQQLVARALRESATPGAQFAFFMGARALIAEELSLARRDDDILVRDRCFVSSYAYQCWRLVEQEPRLDTTTLFLLLAGDDPSRYAETLLFYLDAPVDIVLSRMETLVPVGNECYRRRDDLERTRAMYEDGLRLVQQYLPQWRVERVDATVPLPSVQTDVLSRVRGWLGLA